jgi:hypothetical protein
LLDDGLAWDGRALHRLSGSLARPFRSPGELFRPLLGRLSRGIRSADPRKAPIAQPIVFPFVFHDVTPPDSRP